MRVGLAILGLAMGAGMVWVTDAGAEEYMKRGASVEDYEQALNRVTERKRGLVTGRERLTTTAAPPQASAAQSAAGNTDQPHPVSSPRRPAQTPNPKPAHLATATTPSTPAVGADIHRPDPDAEGDTTGLSILFWL